MVEKVPNVGSLSEEVTVTVVELAVTNRFTQAYPYGLQENNVSEFFYKLRHLLKSLGKEDMSKDEFKNLLDNLPNGLIKRVEDENGETIYLPNLTEPIDPRTEKNIKILPLAN